VSRARQIGALVVVLALVYALVGGEYTTAGWLELRRQERAQNAAIAELTVQVDSLRRYAKRLATDPRLQERLAREEFGMVRPGEFLYRLGRDSLDAQ
jgi:cell division protein FtsB